MFTSRISDWWPKGRTIGQAPHAAIVIEPCAGGRWFERDTDGNETQWGKVLAWEPPARLLLAWQISTLWRYDADLLTEVELTFVPADGGTLVTLEHRDLERFGTDGPQHAKRLDGGWPGFLGEFARHVDSHT